MSDQIPSELSQEIPFISEPASAYSEFKSLVESSTAISFATIHALATRSASGPHDTSLESEVLTFEAQVGRPNFVPSWFLTVGAERAKSVGVLKCSGVDYKGRIGTWAGTGTLISGNILLTNHHVLNSKEVAQSATMVLGYEFNENSELQEGSSFKLNPSRLFITSPVTDGLDFTLCWIDNVPSEYGYCQVRRHMFSVQEADPANIIQHPDQRPKEVVIQENRITSISEKCLYYEADTEFGSSGALVFSNSWRPVALHHATRTRVVNGKSVVENEGIKLSAIATLLENLSQGGEGAEMASEALALFKSTDVLLGGFGSLGRVRNEDSNVESVVKSYRGEGKDLDIGFWNVEWLSERYEDKVDQVADLIVQMNLDVWCISESSPKAATVLADRLNQHYGVPFKAIASEPNAPTTKQSNTVLYNSKTVHVEKRSWPSKVENLLKASSRDDLNLESVHGKIFDRYPAWYSVTFLENPDLKVNVVPLHLKAKDEGSLRRRLASKILTKAVEIAISDDTSGLAKNGWLLGGDLNATLASKDFDSLEKDKFIALSAKDSLDQAGFSYIKSPYKSLIDHVFMSPGLTPILDEDDFFIVAADLSLSNFLKISDHRPVLVRMSLSPEAQPGVVEADILSKLLIEADSMQDEKLDLISPVVENRRRTYYEREEDQRQMTSYYSDISFDGDSQTLRERLENLLSSTHTNELGYNPKVHLYPWVDWRPNGKCESIYSGKSFDPEELIESDIEIEARLESAIRVAVLNDNFSLESVSESLESQYILNCEHVVPQSWFQKLQPMKGDLHHLFACEPDCNSFRGNYRYIDFDDFEAIRDDCGRSERSTFEPKSGKGPVARATLYFLIRYPGKIDNFYSRSDIAMLVAWSENDTVGEYERHRNWAIQEAQGNRNPFIDFPNLASKLFTE